ncbi:aromatic-L-amino-acid decarboxylase [Agrilus planipennis]|uniref:Aromatic-L-amino-acid decarboxylase n=1 Tax=Agrilus planipennis TaxID=224129 RepID=A0A7F5RCG2_AGRPL|nr:aromatic-L-amino-acid decarboxylase [Agrilus planipennis]
MNSEEFKQFGKAMIDYIATYLDNIRNRDVIPSVEPGYMTKLVPEEAPTKGENWRAIMTDLEKVIMPGITHWHSPYFHAYFPTANSYPAIVGELLSAGIGCVGFSWFSSPACTELEMLVMNWLAKLLGLPDCFLNKSGSSGGGTIQGSASETTFICLIAARDRTIKRIKQKFPHMTESDIRGRLVAYTSDQANSSVEKAGLIAAIPMKHLPSNEYGKLTAETLLEAVEKDESNGMFPCYVVATLGSTGTCAFDKLEEIGPICKKEGVWLHIDAAYAGTAFVCPEYRHLMKGIEFADSFNFNPHKWMLVNSDCSAMWLKESQPLIDAFKVERIYLRHKYEGLVPDYRHWQISLGRRFRALKVWFTLRIYGTDGIRNHIRHQASLAKYFEYVLKKDHRFDVPLSNMGLVLFNLRAGDNSTQKLLNLLTERKKLYLIPCHFMGKLVVRFVVCSRFTTAADIEFSLREIIAVANKLLLPTQEGVWLHIDAAYAGTAFVCQGMSE